MATTFYATQFLFSPSTQTQGSQPPRVLKAPFGDGYQQRLKDGAEAGQQIWNLTFTNRSPAELKVIDDFLDSFHGVDAFLWKPPAPFAMRWFVCKDWNFEYGEGEIMTGINAQFVELGGSTLPAQLIIISGDFQSGVAGHFLSQPLVVQVLDSTSTPIVGFPLAWAVIAGGGHISASSNVTDAGGFASVTLQLGPALLTNQVQVIGLGLSGSPAIFYEYTVSPDAGNWAGNSFDWMADGPIVSAGTEVNVGDTSLPIGSSFFLTFANWVGQDFDAVATGVITVPPATAAGEGDTTLSAGRFV